jgi:hypothetical protein
MNGIPADDEQRRALCLEHTKKESAERRANQMILTFSMIAESLSELPRTRVSDLDSGIVGELRAKR